MYDLHTMLLPQQLSMDLHDAIVKEFHKALFLIQELTPQPKRCGGGLMVAEFAGLTIFLTTLKQQAC